MLISKTPLRVSFVGGGSDLKKFYRNYKGATISMGINMYVYVIITQGFDNIIRINHSKIENVDYLYNIRHPIIRTILEEFGTNNSINISVLSDIHAHGSGLGSSSSLTVGLINALTAYKKSHISKTTLATEACRIEIDVLKNPIGKQDQYAAAFGGLNLTEFHSNDTVTVTKIKCKRKTLKKLEENLIIFYTGIHKSSSSILKKYNKNLDADNKNDLIKKMVEISYQLRKDLENDDLSSFGKLLHENWILKKQIEASISNGIIDKYYEIGLKHGAIGGKLLGAGGRGYILFFAPPTSHDKIIKALRPLKYSKIKSDKLGSRIIEIDKL